MGVCNRRLLAITVPDTISRPPWTLDFKKWKGESMVLKFSVFGMMIQMLSLKEHSQIDWSNHCTKFWDAFELLIVCIHVGSECRSWVLFYSLPVLLDILPIKHLSPYALLVASVHMLLSDRIPVSAIDVMKNWLQRFYHDYESIYGNKFQQPHWDLLCLPHWICVISYYRCEVVCHEYPFA